MDVKLDVRLEDIRALEVDAIVVNLFEDVQQPGGATGAIDGALDGAIRELIEGGDLRGKQGEVAVLYPRGALPARRVLVVGLGSRDDFDRNAIRQAAASAARRARALGARSIATIAHGAGIGGLEPEACAQATVEGTLLALYRYARTGHGGQEDDDRQLERVTLLGHDEAQREALERGARTGRILADAVWQVRDLVNMPPNEATPREMARVARRIGEDFGLKVEVGGREWASGHDMGAFLAVAQGAGEPPRFIVMEHGAQQEDQPTVVLVGKGVTFDTGGISLKPPGGMPAMKSDMAGAAAVIGAMQAVAALELPLHVVGLAPCTENMPDAAAYRPSDVITASNGATIEIVSTDAEGRMILSDALVYAQRYEPAAVIDMATLTGAAVVALGRGMGAALFSTQDDLRDRLLSAAESSGERLWPMPLWPEYTKKLKSEVADLKNTGGRMGGVGTSAAFLKRFTEYPWAHIDFAGMATEDDGTDVDPKGATGYGVRLLVELLRAWG